MRRGMLLFRRGSATTFSVTDCKICVASGELNVNSVNRDLIDPIFIE
jgi:hypothetical protein